jgi:polyferredoxin
MRSNITAATRSIAPAKSFNHKWVTGLIMAAVLALGWKYPLWGFVVPVAMGAGILGGFFRGRWVCGNLCPRGSFLDTWFNLVSAKKENPVLLSGKKFRWSTLTMLMSFMVFRLAQNPGEVDHWGLVFWQMCLVTTIAAFALGLRYSARSWCTFCPVGTLASSIGGEKYPLQVHSSCKTCGLCEKSCPMQLSIPQHRQSGSLQEQDCIKCSECIKACPRNDVLKWPLKKAA